MRKRRIPRPQHRNRTWGLDLTGKADLERRQQTLGLLHYGTHAALALSTIAHKCSLTVVRELIVAFRQCGMPRTLRVDNEACFTSKIARAALALLGIRLQRIDLHCPWMNGRIERLFGTLKRHPDPIRRQDSRRSSNETVRVSRLVHPCPSHQHLLGMTPAEAWAGRRKTFGNPKNFVAWGETGESVFRAAVAELVDPCFRHDGGPSAQLRRHS